MSISGPALSWIIEGIIIFFVIKFIIELLPRDGMSRKERKQVQKQRKDNQSQLIQEIINTIANKAPDFDKIEIKSYIYTGDCADTLYYKHLNRPGGGVEIASGEKVFYYAFDSHGYAVSPATAFALADAIVKRFGGEYNGRNTSKSEDDRLSAEITILSARLINAERDFRSNMRRC